MGIDPLTPPSYKLYEKEESEYAILIFHSGPPYQDVAFKIVNNEWEPSHRRGFRCRFEKGISFKTSGIRDLRLPFYYSACNRDWTPITDGENDLYFDEALCCNPDGSYYNCDGSETNDQC